MPRGPSNCRVPLPYEPYLVRKVPLDQNTWMRWFPVSETTMSPMSDVRTTPAGDENCPSPVPLEPNLKRNAPLEALKTWMRSLEVSATASRPRLTPVPRDMAAGDENCPSPVPLEPNTKSRVPLGWKTWMRSLEVSAT